MNQTIPKVVLPEGSDERVQTAAALLVEEGVCLPVLVGTDLPDIDGVQVVDPVTVDLAAYDRADEVDPSLAAGAALVASGTADAIVSGAVATTADVFRAYRRIIGMQPGVSRAAGCFLMERGDQRYLYADCGVNPDPDAELLASIGQMAADLAQSLGIEPRVAFLSFATGASAKHAHVDKVVQAVHIAKETYPDLVCDGPLQFDAAFVPDVAMRKAPDSPLRGNATVFVFPDLDAGNIAYKLTERLAGFSAAGPLLTGFAKPAHDLSRGCNAQDIVNVAKVAVLQCQ